MKAASEGRFTAPRPECPHPENWTSADDDSTEIEVTALVAAFVTALQPEFVLETGTAWGQTAEAIGRALRANGHGRLVTLELNGVRAQHARQRCTGLPVEVLEMRSLEYVPTTGIDFAWFDSLVHLRHLEYQHFQHQFSSRGVAGFHDTGSQHPVRGFLDTLVTAGIMPEPMYLPTPRGACFVRVECPL